MAGGEPGPGYCFVSHSYGDESALAACLECALPEGREPFVFPKIDVSPSEAVSDAVISAIRACGGFVYLDTDVSRASFWVGFERNIAARLGKPVHAFRQGWMSSRFRRDARPAIDPVIGIVLNLAVPEDVENLQRVRETIWDRYNFEFRGDKWRRLENDVRQMLDSIDGIRAKYAAGGVTLLFLSNASITGGHHDYVDPFTFRRAQKDMETPVGYTAQKFAALDPARTVTLWFDDPDEPAIEATLSRLEPGHWAPYVRMIRHALAEPTKLVAFQPDRRLHLNHLDTMLARAFAAAIDTDARLAAEFRGRIVAAR